MLVLLTLAAAPVLAFSIADHVVFSEVFYDPVGNDTAWVELFNPTVNNINISGYTIKNNNGTFTIPDVTIPIPSNTTLIINLTLDLNIGGDNLTLFNKTNKISDRIFWKNYTNSNWFIEAIEGTSLERVPAFSDTDSPNDWLSSQTPSPGTVRFELCPRNVSVSMNPYYRPNTTLSVIFNITNIMCNPENNTAVIVIIQKLAEINEVNGSNVTVFQDTNATNSMGFYNSSFPLAENITLGNYSVFVNTTGYIQTSVIRVCIDCDNDTYNSSLIIGGTDCNDDNVNINPGESEVCGNGNDEDCNSNTSDICPTTSTPTTAPDASSGSPSSEPPVPKPKKTTTTESTTTEPTTTIETTTTEETTTLIEENVTEAESSGATGFAIGDLSNVAPVIIGAVAIIAVAAAVFMYRKNAHKKVYKYVAGGIKKK